MSLSKNLRGTLAATAATGIGAAIYGLTHAHAYTVRHRTLYMPAERVYNATPTALCVASDNTQKREANRDSKASQLTLPPQNQHAPSAQLRILHISDAHALARHRNRFEFIASLAAYEPDLIVITGDMFAHSSALSPLRAALAPLADIPGVFVCGSNDYYAPKLKNPFQYLLGPSSRKMVQKSESTPPPKPKARPLPWQDLVQIYEDFGWVNLTNTRAMLPVAGWECHFVGVDDPHIRRDVFPIPHGDKPVPDLHCASETSVLSLHPQLRIGLTHAPYLRILDEMARDNCDLVFAGHTHGGQVCLPGKHLVSNCDIDPQLAAGLFHWPATTSAESPLRDGQLRHTRHGLTELIAKDGAAQANDDMWVQVSAGIGTTTYAPVRTFCPPEAIILDLIVQ
ncbi:metallophosphoesterase [Trueperella sp. LYQ141]|uniref:metallophosphoesterase n=1 Tax=Trueperella sp. LYQ141 TaxID=3391058 RepID=UPI003983D8AF